MTQKIHADSYAEIETPFNYPELQPIYSKKKYEMCSSTNLPMMIQLSNFSQGSMNKNFIKSQSCCLLDISNFSTNKNFKKYLKEKSKMFFKEFILLYSNLFTLLRNEGFDEESVILFFITLEINKNSL